ncbi:hypothetical protein [Mucilaginibacter ginsenosidivorans]|uniref:Uncharacterized protein n=1 Tax=Mucilaginibacter ginsenosidivorans TaxID=398053 RepID=A0A5B8UV53_9SPHI|nr:hypothetical protein [Mucilaginibacter ginsenosidivorans]QEC62813.1 hypothetical protein FRZ54_09530 [Mucilaginibacter ginsenosidivorans]
MNIDDLKDAWGKDEPKEMHLPVSTETLGKTNSVVERIRKNMRSELIALLVSYAILLIYLFGGVRTNFLFNITSILFFVILVLNCFYYFRFYVFYKSIARYDFNLKNNIRKITYELELNTEIYKTYNFSVTPIAILATITLISSKVASDRIQHFFAASSLISPGTLLAIFAVILISFIITYVCISWHVRLQYGKYVAELKRVMNDLGEDE